VRPEDITRFARDLDQLDQSCARAISYAGYTRPRTDGGSAMVRFLNATANVEPAVVKLFSDLQALVARSADELVATAKYYQDTDDAVAADSDRLYGQVHRD
jgi:hypothetical protein